MNDTTNATDAVPALTGETPDPVPATSVATANLLETTMSNGTTFPEWFCNSCGCDERTESHLIDCEYKDSPTDEDLGITEEERAHQERIELEHDDNSHITDILRRNVKILDESTNPSNGWRCPNDEEL